MGRHPGKPHLAWFGGFSSKGVLTAPSYATRFLDYLLDGKALPSEVADR
jgi:glycine/D-amino acid oxidase-like deaminating enzyme